MNPKIERAICAAAMFCAAMNLNSASAAEGTNAPAITATPPGTNAPAGGRGGGRGSQVALSDADQAEIATLASFPAWSPGAGEGNYFIGPAYAPAPEQTPKDGVPKGRIEKFLVNAADSKFFPNTGLRGTASNRMVTVYIPSQYLPGTPAPLIVSCDAYGARSNQLANILDNMIADHRLPPIIAVMIANGGGDGPGSERGLEYDTVWGKYAEFVEAEILPKVEKDYGVTITKNPDGRMTLGGSSGGSAAFSMAWFHPELYHRVLTYSGTYVAQARDAENPHGAWGYHETLVPNSPAKPLRIWMEVGERDNGATAGSSGFHNWVIANIRMAEVLKAKGYHYQFIYAKGAGHTDGRTIAQTYPQALEWVWQGYPVK